MKKTVKITTTLFLLVVISSLLFYALPAYTKEDEGCFIATSAYDSKDAEDIKILKQFRDKHLKTTKWGRSFVELYYKISPPMARLIERHSILKKLTRWALKPVVAFAKFVNFELKPCEYKSLKN